MNVGLVGCGLIGRKRAAALGTHRLVIAADVQIDRARQLTAGHPGAVAVEDWRSVVAHAQVDAVLVATTHDMLAPITLAAVNAGKHILVEKPAGRTTAELAPILEAAHRRGVTVKVGLNHRFHPAMLKARELIDTGVLGPLLFLRGRYGHGGRVGYEKEWRANPAVSGGGELLDQGMHLIDLARWYLGDLRMGCGHLATYFWDMPVEDNAFLLLETPAGQVAWLHVSWTEWKNLFSVEIYGRHAKLQIDGLGGSYGPESLIHYAMAPTLGPPAVHRYEFPGDDQSWVREFEDFCTTITTGRAIGADLHDAFEALRLVDAVYKRGPS